MSGSANGNVEDQENELGHGERPPKTAKQLEKEAIKLAKLERYKQKQDKLKEASLHTMEKVEVCSTLTRNQSCTILYALKNFFYQHPFYSVKEYFELEKFN